MTFCHFRPRSKLLLYFQTYLSRFEFLHNPCFRESGQETISRLCLCFKGRSVSLWFMFRLCSKISSFIVYICGLCIYLLFLSMNMKLLLSATPVKRNECFYIHFIGPNQIFKLMLDSYLQ